MSRRVPTLAAAACVVAAGGCGAERTPVPKVEPRAGEPTRPARYPKAGVTLSVPRRAAITPRRLPGVARIAYGEATVGVFAYRRAEQLPRTRGEVDAARVRLIAEVRGRGPRFRVVRSRITRVDGAPAIELIGDQTILRSRTRTRSVHVFKGNGEYVIDMLAPVARFTESDRNLFTPLVESVELSGRIAAPARRR